MARNEEGEEEEMCCGCFSCATAPSLLCGKDLAGLICASISWFVMVFCSWTVLFCLKDIPWKVLGPYIVLVLCAMVSHLQTMLRDPGFLPLKTGAEEWKKLRNKVYATHEADLIKRRQDVLEANEQAEVLQEEMVNGRMIQTLVPKRKKHVMSDQEIKFKCDRAVEKFRRKERYCNICQCFKVETAHHCSVCGRCVDRMDHHCPWVNTCVGARNLRFFLLFLFYVFLSSIYSMALFGYRSYIVLWYPPERTNTFLLSHPPLRTSSSPWPLVACIFSVLLCIFFCIFVVAMTCDQYDALTSGIPGIDALQDQGEDEELTLYQGLRKYACSGRRISFWWFIPIDLPARKSSSSSSSSEKLRKLD